MMERYRRYRAGRRWLIALGVVAIAVFHGVVIARVFLSPEQFRLRTELFLQRLSAGEVEVGGAGYEFPRRFRIDSIRMLRPQDRGGGMLFGCQGLTLHFGWLSLLRGGMALEELELVEPELVLTPRDLRAMKRPERKPGKAEVRRVIVRGGRVHLGPGMLFEGSPAEELRQVEMDLRRERHRANSYTFHGSAESDLWGRCDLEGRMDLQRRRLDVDVVARGVAVDHRVRQLLPPVAVQALERYNLRGLVDVTVQSSLSWGGPSPPAVRMVKATIELRDCQAAWERFPLRVTHIRGRVVFDGTNLYYRDISGRCGSATVELDGRTTEEKVTLRLVARGRALDQEFYEKAYPQLQAVWDRCGLRGGYLDLDYQSEWDRKERVYRATVVSRLRDVEAVYPRFPYPLHDIAGTIRWEGSSRPGDQPGDWVSQGVSHIEGLTGRHERARVEVTGRVTDEGVPDLTVRAFDVPFDATLRDALHESWRGIYDDLRPQGTSAIEVRITSPAMDPREIQYVTFLRPQGASFRYGTFPHRITDVRGEIRIGDNAVVSFQGLRGRLAEFPLSFLGSIRLGGERPGPDIRVVADELTLGPAARDILSGAWAEAYDRLDPRGKVALAWHFGVHPDSGEPRQTTHIRCLPQADCSICHRAFPVRISDLVGRITVDERGRLTFTGMRGRIGEATVEAIDGRYIPGSEGGLHFTLRAADLSLDEPIREALPEAWRDVWDQLQPTGRVAAEYRFAEDPQTPAESKQRVTIQPEDASFTYRRFPIPVTELSRGKVTFDQDGNATITNLQGKVHGKPVRLDGKVEAREKTSVLELTVEADELTLGPRLRAALPETWQETWDRFRPAGTVALNATLVADLRRGTIRQADADATLKGCSATWEGLPMGLTELRGRLEYEDGETRLVDIEGQCPAAAGVRLAGVVRQKGEVRAELDISARELQLAEPLWEALPADVRGPAKKAELKGALDVESLRITLPRDPRAPVEWAAILRLRGCSFQARYPFEELNGELRVDRATTGPDGSQHIEGSLGLRRATVRGLLATDLEGSVAFTRGPRRGDQEQAPASVRLGNVGGSFYGGRISGSAEIDLVGTQPFRGQAFLNGVDFKLFCAEALGAKKKATGSLGMRLEFPPGTYTEEKGLQGDGRATVRDGELGDLPLAATLLKVVGLDPTIERAITRADMKFGIAADHLEVKEFTLSGERRLMTGHGTIGFDSSLDLTFYSPKKGTVLSEVFRVVADNLVEVRVSGTAMEPEARVNPVPIIPRALDQFNRVLGIWRRLTPGGSR